MNNKPLRKSQFNFIRKLFIQGATLNHITAFKLTGCTTIVQRVKDLKELGYNIMAKRVMFKTRFGTYGYYNDYKLIKKGTPKELLNVKFDF